MQFIRVPPDERRAIVVTDPQPLTGSAEIWTAAAQFSTVGIFVLLFGAFLLIGRPLLLPVVTAIVVAMTLAPVVRAGSRYAVPTWLSAILLVGLMGGAAGLGITLMADPVGEWIAKAPEFGAAIKQKLYVLDRPLAALRDLQKVLAPPDPNAVTLDRGVTELLSPLVALLTPAMTQLVLFVVTLLFLLAGQAKLRHFLVSLMPSREGRLRMLRIDKDIERNLAGYLAVISVINIALGFCVFAIAWLLDYPAPAVLGALTAILNFIPYIGSAVMAMILFGIGLVVFPTFGQSLIAPAAFVAISTIEGQIVTPTIMGRRLTLNPLLVVLSLAFWTWMWGPIGAFLALPLSIVALVVYHHLFPNDDPRLPD